MSRVLMHSEKQVFSSRLLQLYQHWLELELHNGIETRNTVPPTPNLLISSESYHYQQH